MDTNSSEFFNKTSFELWVEQNKENFGCSYIDTIVSFMERYGLDEVDTKELISPNLVLKLKNEAILSRVLKSNSKRTNFSEIF